MGLEAYFIGDTPRVEGSNIVFQVETNKPASLRCRFGSGVVACKLYLIFIDFNKFTWPGFATQATNCVHVYVC